MTKVKNALSSMAFAATLLVACGVAQFGIINLVKTCTGWKMPKWLAIVIAGLGATGAIVAAVASCGVSLPASVIAACKCLTAATA